MWLPLMLSLGSTRPLPSNTSLLPYSQAVAIPSGGATLDKGPSGFGKEDLATC